MRKIKQMAAIISLILFGVFIADMITDQNRVNKAVKACQSAGQPVSSVSTKGFFRVDVTCD